MGLLFHFLKKSNRRKLHKWELMSSFAKCNFFQQTPINKHPLLGKFLPAANSKNGLLETFLNWLLCLHFLQSWNTQITSRTNFCPVWFIFLPQRYVSNLRKPNYLDHYSKLLYIKHNTGHFHLMWRHHSNW